jgi:hypothetical protein
MSDHPQATLDEQRRAAMRPVPTREEMEAAHKERLAMIENPPLPLPTQEEADAMKEGAYEQAQADPEAQQASSAKKERDMKPAPGGEYQTR